MSNPKVSIIIPVYKVSQFLRKCLDSVVNQTLQEIEIIIVNDASPDPLDEEICLEYVRKDSRITYTKHEKNKRQGEARNTGMQIAKGEYIGFVDSDDSIHPEMYQDMYTQAKEGGFDIVQCGISRMNTQYKTIEKLPQDNKKQELDNTIEIAKLYFAGKISSSVCDKIFHRKLIVDNKIKFLPIIYEDAPFAFSSIMHCNRLLILEKHYYYYYNNEYSTMTSLIDDIRVKSQFRFCDEIYNTVIENNLKDKVYKKFLYYVLTLSCVMAVKIKNASTRKLFFNSLHKATYFKENKFLILTVYLFYILEKTQIWSLLKKIKLEAIIKKIYRFVKDSLCSRTGTPTSFFLFL